MIWISAWLLCMAVLVGSSAHGSGVIGCIALGLIVLAGYTFLYDEEG